MNPDQEPFLQIFCGPMFAGKTTKLHSQMTEYKYNKTGYKVLCINHSINKRYGSSNSKTHKQESTGEHLEIDNCVSTAKLMSLLPINLDNNVFIVDEGQFFPDLIEFVNIILSYKKNIIIGGLDYDIERRRFGQILVLSDMINNNI
jgi:thymidine kinase